MVSRVVYSNLKKLKLARQTSEWNKTKSRFRQQITNEAKISNKQCIKTRLQYLQRAQQCTRLSPCWNVRMAKNSLGDWSCINLADENPQGTPDPVTGPQGWRTRSTLFDFWQATLPHFFSLFSSSDSSRSVKALQQELRIPTGKLFPETKKTVCTNEASVLSGCP